MKTLAGLRALILLAVFAGCFSQSATPTVAPAVPPSEPVAPVHRPSYPEALQVLESEQRLYEKVLGHHADIVAEQMLKIEDITARLRDVDLHGKYTSRTEEERTRPLELIESLKTLGREAMTTAKETIRGSQRAIEDQAKRLEVARQERDAAYAREHPDKPSLPSPTD